MAFSKSLALKLCNLSLKSYTDSALTYKNGDNGFLLEVEGDTQYLAFPGSYQFMDWVTDTEFIKAKRENMGSLHGGFADTWDLLKHEVMNRLDRRKKLILTGHSLGGAVATIAALSLFNEGFEINCLYTYGSPRVGNAEWKTNFDKSGIVYYRIKNGDDFVTTVPKVFFEHVGQEIKIGKKKWFVLFSLFDHKMENYLASLEKLGS